MEGAGGFEPPVRISPVGLKVRVLRHSVTLPRTRERMTIMLTLDWAGIEPVLSLAEDTGIEPAAP